MFLRNLLDYFTPRQSSITKEDALFDGLIITLMFFLRALSFNIFLLKLTCLECSSELLVPPSFTENY
jgi:hypothetical protein